MKKLLIILALTIISTNANAEVKRGVFTSDGQYIMNYQKNDHLSPNHNNNSQNFNGHQSDSSN
jgi:hypothetical protein